MAIETVDQIWADFNEDGSVKEPHKLAIRLNLRALWAAASANGMKVYATKAEMDADTTQADRQPALIYADPTPANNYPTVWIWDDAETEWIGGNDRLGEVETRLDGLINLWPDPHAAGINASAGAGTVANVSGEMRVRFLTSGLFDAYDFPAVDAFAVGETLVWTGEKQSNATTANIAFAALIYFDANGVEISRDSWLTSASTARLTFSITGTVPANTATVQARYGKGSAGTTADFWPETFSLTSSAPPTEVFVTTHNNLEPLRDVTAAVLPAARTRTNRVRVTDLPNGPRIVRLHNEAWREEDGRVLSAADGPCTVAGVEYVFAMRDAKSVDGTVYELWDQNHTMRMVPIAATPVIRDRAGIAHTNGSGRLGAESVGSLSARLVDMVMLPDPPAPTPPDPQLYNVPTGLARVPLQAGQKYAGCFVVGNDGRPTEAQTGYHGRIMLRSPDLRQPIAEWDMLAAIPGLKSIQGVAVPIIGGVATIAFIDYGGKALRRLDFTGARIPAGDVDLSGYGAQPNGLAWDPDALGFWVSFPSDGKAVLIPPAGGTAIRTIAVPTSTDHLTCAGGYLWVFPGNNGSNGLCRPYNPVTGCRITEYADLPYAQSIEGGVVELPATGGVDIWTANDGWLHTLASPQLNTFLHHRAEIAPPPKITTGKLLVTMAMRTTATPSGTQYLIADGGPGDTAWYGWAVAVRAVSGGLRFQARTPGDGAVVNVDVTASTIADGNYHILSLEADIATDTATFYVDGVSAGSGSISGIGREFDISRLSLFGAIGSVTGYLGNTRVVGVAIGNNAVRADVETYMIALCRGAL